MASLRQLHGFFPLVLLAVALAGCGSTERNRPGTSAAGGTANAGGEGNEGNEAGAAAELAAVPSDLHRLNSVEYQATVGDVLGSSVPLSLAANDAEANGFDNIGAVLGMSEEQYSRYLEAAELVAGDVFAAEATRTLVVTCDQQDDAACIQSVIAETGLRLFRRPLFEQESPIYEQVYAAARERGDLHEAALEQVLVALLASAQFLYRMEFPSSAPGAQPLGPYELASRLSYLLWSSAPDDELLQAAQSDALSADAEVEAQLRRLWSDHRSERFSANFGGQWLGARRLLRHQVDPSTFPEWRAELGAAAASELYEYFDAFVREDRNWLEFLTGRPHEIDGGLAALYGLAPAASGDRVLLEGERAGYLGSVGFLTLTSLDRRTQPSHRGRIILQDLLCQPLPPPPPDVPQLDAMEQPRTMRQYLESLWLEPVCAVCHRQVDPLGLALDRYDAIGRYRTSYENGEPIDDSVTLLATETYRDLQVVGLSGVVERLTSDPAFTSCVVNKLYSYGLGRMPAELDARNIELLTQDWQAGPLTIRELVRQLALSTPFRFRNEEAVP